MLGTWLIGDEEASAAAEVIASRSLFRHYGPRLLHRARALEVAFADVTGVPHALAVSSGTSALRSALAALRPAAGSEILVPPCTFAATINAIVLAGCVPVFCEIDGSLGLDPERLAERITARTVGVIPVHLQGLACRIDAIADVARRHGLWVVEDCAQALGVRYRGRHVGGFGEFGAFSLQAHKTITCGEGGLLIARDRERFDAARRFHDQGGERDGDAYPSWDHPDAGFGDNLKMSELHAAVALAQLGKLEAIRSAMRQRHQRMVAELDLAGRAARPDPDPAGSLPHAFVFFARDPADREQLLARLADAEIPADDLYGEPLYRSAPLVRWSRGEPVLGCPHPELRPRFAPCPDAEQLMARTVRVPLSPVYSPDDMDHLIATLRRCL
ncbi:MAG TPA: DegT/DnrJ/EryC1/StrS family aminotransferase [Kofleriaceae bacterium]|jgi:dTDP-4-amino-4,6-dideoxygalactose transaminase|nr:DegT/DnrJ/EryC1/StrS family aminotransferase [Kofleriaceae bacterium]